MYWELGGGGRGGGYKCREFRTEPYWFGGLTPRFVTNLQTIYSHDTSPWFFWDGVPFNDNISVKKRKDTNRIIHSLTQDFRLKATTHFC